MFSVLNIFNKYLVVSYNCCHSGDNLGLWAHSVLDQWHLHLEISCLHGKQRGYTVDVKVFLSCFFFGYLYFQNKSISDSFWFVSLCLFVFFLHLNSCLYIQARYEGYEFPNFRCSKYMRYMFHLFLQHSTLRSKSYLWI